jgi:hypothetical protein
LRQPEKLLGMSIRSGVEDRFSLTMLASSLRQL